MSAPDRDPRETLARIREQADAATEGPWSVYRGKRCGTYVTGPDMIGVAREWSLTWKDADAEFIAAARTDVPWLLEQVELRQKALDAVVDLADQLDAEDEAMHDFYGWERNDSGQTNAPSSRIRKAITAVLEGETND